MVKAQLAAASSPKRMNDTSTVYADYQATTPLDPRVHDRMAPFWSQSFGNPHSSDHAVGWQAQRAVDAAAASVAALIGADADEIVFTSGATEANNLALFGLAGRAPPERNGYSSARLSTNAYSQPRAQSPRAKASPSRPFPSIKRECSI